MGTYIIQRDLYVCVSEFGCMLRRPRQRRKAYYDIRKFSFCI